MLYRAGTKLLDFAGDPLQPILTSMADYARVLVIPIDVGVARGPSDDPRSGRSGERGSGGGGRWAAGQLSLTIEAWQPHSELRIAAASEERIRLGARPA